MKKGILMVVLAAVSCGAWAQQWVAVSENSVGDVFYIDPTTIRKDGHLRRYWLIADLAKSDKDGRSYRAFQENDCKDERVRSLQEDNFRGPMGSGEKSSGSQQVGNWRFVAPGTTGAEIMKFVCSR